MRGLKRLQRKKILKCGYLSVFISLLLCVGLTVTAFGEQNDIYLMKISDAISPGVADFIKSGIKKASSEKAACLIIELDTPGGLAEAMHDIVMSILASKVPVVVYVSPSGARAASAGVMITMAADVAAMAPGTNIGAAHPVATGGQEIDKTMSDKIVNDMVAPFQKCCGEKGSKCRLGGEGHSGKCIGDGNPGPRGKNHRYRCQGSG